jgi:hypothetical protein
MLTRAFVLIDHHATTSTQDKTQKQQRLDGVVQKQNHCRRARRDSRQSSIPIIGRRLIVLLRILIEKFLAVIVRRHAMLQLLRTADGQTDLRATTDGRKLHLLHHDGGRWPDAAGDDRDQSHSLPLLPSLYRRALRYLFRLLGPPLHAAPQEETTL